MFIYKFKLKTNSYNNLNYWSIWSSAIFN